MPVFTAEECAPPSYVRLERPRLSFALFVVPPGDAPLIADGSAPVRQIPAFVIQGVERCRISESLAREFGAKEEGDPIALTLQEADPVLELTSRFSLSFPTEFAKTPRPDFLLFGWSWLEERFRRRVVTSGSGSKFLALGVLGEESECDHFPYTGAERPHA